MHSKKLGPIQTFFTLMKGFLGAAVLYLPKEVQEGGWLFSGIALILSFIFTSYCIFKLLEAKKKCHATNFRDIGERAYGFKGKLAVEIFLVLSQLGFVLAYIYFIASQL